MPQFIYATRTVMYGLMRDAYRCAVAELHVVMSQRAAALLLSVRSRIVEHLPHCIEERESSITVNSAAFHHTVTSSDHIGWALLPTRTA